MCCSFVNQCMDVSTLSTADTLAPLSSSSSTISMFLILVALIRGVSPSWDRKQETQPQSYYSQHLYHTTLDILMSQCHTELLYQTFKTVQVMTGSRSRCAGVSPWCRSQCQGYIAGCLSPWWRFPSPQPSTELSYCPSNMTEWHIITDWWQQHILFMVVLFILSISWICKCCQE